MGTRSPHDAAGSTAAAPPELPPREGGRAPKLATVRGAWRMRIRRSSLASSPRLVAYTLAEFMDEAGVCYVRLETIQRASGLSESTVRRALQQLARRRFVARSRTDGRFCWTFAARLIPRGVNTTPRGRTVTARGVTTTARGVTTTPRTGVRNRGLEPKGKALASHETEPVANATAAGVAGSTPGGSLRLKSLTPEEAEAEARAHPELAGVFAAPAKRRGRR